MDIVSHGLWGGLAFGRKNRNSYLWAFGIGVMPDLLSFGIYTAGDVLGLVSGPEWGNGLPDPKIIPDFVYTLYNITHSLIIFAVVFGLLWFLKKKIFLPLFAWGLHILLDIPTHSSAFFPTPFLWPLSDFKISGVGWGQPIIFFPNLILLALGYIAWLVQKKFFRNSTKA